MLEVLTFLEKKLCDVVILDVLYKTEKMIIPIINKMINKHNEEDKKLEVSLRELLKRQEDTAEQIFR